MKKKLQLTIEQHHPSAKNLQVQPWVGDALNAKRQVKTKSSRSNGQMLQLNMTFSKQILNKR